VLGEVRRHGVDASRVAFRAGRLGVYYLDPGAVLRPPEVIYDRSHTAFLAATPGLDWPRLLDGAAWLHLSGASAATGPEAADACLAAARQARAAGVKVSFDGNYRAKLWTAWGGDPAPVLRDLLALADLAFVDHRDIALALGRPARPGPSDEALRVAAAEASPPSRP
jgi:2-dehydro-3-deoxygluconokinase